MAEKDLRSDAPEVLQNMQRLLSEAERLAGVGSWIWRRDQTIWSSNLYEIFEFPRGAAPSLESFLARVHPEDRGVLDQITRHALSGTPLRCTVEYRVILPKRGVRTITAASEIRALSNGESEFIGAAQDITERRHDEAALRKALQDRNLAVSAANVGLWDWDVRTNRVVFSDEWKRQLGYEPHEIPGKADEWVSRLHPDDRAGALERQRAYLEHPVGRFQSEFRLRHRDGSWRWILTQASMVHDSDGKPIRMMGSHLDITEQKAAEAVRRNLELQLRQSQKMQAIGTLAGGVAHDFNNILLAISGNAQLALSDCPADEPMRTSLLEIQRATARATGLIRRMLTFSHMSEVERRPIQLRPVVIEALQLLRAVVPAMVEIREPAASALPNVAADAGQVHQIIMNLGSNAAHAIGQRSGCIDVRLTALDVGEAQANSIADLQTGPYVLLSVHDDGVGMDAATLERVWEPFFTTRAAGEGAGLGLAVVHGIVRSHGGALKVSSERGRGTQIDVYLPVTDHPLATERSDEGEQPRGARQCVLYLDDEDSLVLLISRFLERLGYRVAGFTDPQRALEAFREQPEAYDAFVTDLAMPHLSGFDVTRQVLELRSDIPVIMTSGYVRPEDEATARSLGVRAMVLKPNTVEELARVLHEVFEKS